MLINTCYFDENCIKFYYKICIFTLYKKSIKKKKKKKNKKKKKIKKN